MKLYAWSASTCHELVARFQSVNLSAIDEDLNGRMFERLLNQAVREKGLGQYFTPRSVVDFITRIALEGCNVTPPPETIDACCWYRRIFNQSNGLRYVMITG